LHPQRASTKKIVLCQVSFILEPAAAPHTVESQAVKSHVVIKQSSSISADWSDGGKAGVRYGITAVARRLTSAMKRWRGFGAMVSFNFTDSTSLVQCRAMVRAALLLTLSNNSKDAHKQHKII
jgi:hypothetical protein